jgi:4-hydroxy-tetrahydrodipicolinate synthase
MAEVSGARRAIAGGVIAATLTPMHADGRADVTLLAGHCRTLRAQGCTSIVLLGTTGEANSFTVQERKAILEELLALGVSAACLIVGTGCCARGDTVALTRHALSLGVDRVLMLPPFYYKQVGDDGLFDAFSAVIETVGNDRLRVYLYSIPRVSGVDLSVALIERLSGAYPQTVAGVKDSSGSWDSTKALCQRLGGRLEVLVGTEALLLRALAAGACGCVSATANVNAPAIAQLFERRGTPDAPKLQKLVSAKRAAFEKYPLIPALKAYLAATTAHAGWRNLRPPLRGLSAGDAAALVAEVDRAGVASN